VAVSVDLVGRDDQLAQLRDSVDAASAGEGRVLFLTGEAGIGKSRLARVIASDAARGALPVLRGRATETATPAPYRPLAEALSSGVRAGVAPDASQLGPFRSVLGRLVPEWRGEDHQRLEESQVAVAEGVLRFLRATAGDSGVLVVLEDLHWADPETVTIVEYLADNLAYERVLCVVTVRDDQSSAVKDLLRSLSVRGVAGIIELAPLDLQQVAAMVTSCLAPGEVPDEVVAFAARAGGVPFLVEELLAAALSSGALVKEAGSWRVVKPLDAVVPVSFSQSMRRRVRELGAHGEEVLAVAATLGRRFDWSLIPSATGLSDEDVLRVLHGAVDAQIVSFHPDDGAFRFRHALSRDAVLALLFPPEQQALSRRALDAVEAAHPDLDGQWGELAADLAGGAGDRQRAATLLLDVSRRAFRQGALTSAEATLGRARTLLSDMDPLRLDVDEFLLEVLSLAGKRAPALEIAVGLLERLGTDPQWARRRAEVHVRLARAAIAATQWDQADEHLERARCEAVAVPGEELAARVDVLEAETAIGRDPRQASALARAALDAAERRGLPEVACGALEVLGRTQRPRDLAGAEDAFARALAIAQANGLTVWRARALHELGAIDMLRGRSVERLEEARELALAHGALATAAVVDVQIAAALVISDDPEAGAVAACRSAALARRYRFDQTLAAAVALEAYAHARARRRTEVLRCGEEAAALAAGAPDIEVKTSTATALLALVEEHRPAARRGLCAGLKAAARGGDYSMVPAIGLLALLRQLDGPDDEAPEIESPQESVHFLASAFLRYADAVAAGRSGNADVAHARLTEGDRILSNHKWFRHLGRRLVAEATVAGGWGDPVPWLHEALEFFDRQGDDRIASACRSLLRKTGATVPRRRTDSGVPGELRALGVTAREFEVLQLLALGLPNKDIGARLYLSPRTVERHIANLAVKTGAARRAQLVAYAARTVTRRTS